MLKLNQKVVLYAANISNLPDPKEFPKWLEGLSELRKNKIQCCVQKTKRKQNLGAGLLLRYVLQQYGVSEEDIQIGTHGKPQLDGIFFNLSHSDEWVVCAVGPEVVGCDIEKIKGEPKRIAERFFCESEQKYLRLFEGKEREKEFFRLWTFKESYMKMTGEGMSLALHRIEFVFHQNEAISLYRDGKRCSCYMKEYEIPNYKVSVCSECADFVEEIEFIEFAHNSACRQIL